MNMPYRLWWAGVCNHESNIICQAALSEVRTSHEAPASLPQTPTLVVQTPSEAPGRGWNVVPQSLAAVAGVHGKPDPGQRPPMHWQSESREQLMSQTPIPRKN